MFAVYHRKMGSGGIAAVRRFSVLGSSGPNLIADLDMDNDFDVLSSQESEMPPVR
jgi:hypothetical protein